MGRSESGHDKGDKGGASGRGVGSTGMKEKEVGVVSDCNNIALQLLLHPALVGADPVQGIATQ
jgi:hypothetical protein